MNFQENPMKQYGLSFPTPNEQAKKLREDHPSGFKIVGKQTGNNDNISDQLSDLFDKNNDDSFSNYEKSLGKATYLLWLYLITPTN